MKRSFRIIMVMVCFALIIGAVSAKGNAPGNSGNSYPLFINLTEKDSSVVAPDGAWRWVLDGGFGKLLYKAGPKAMFVFNAAKMAPSTQYALISYAEPYPGTGSTILGTGRSDAGGNVSISGKTDVSKGFVCNRYPTATSEEYQVNGSKVWLVLASDLSQPPGAAVAVPGFETTQFTAWNDADYLFETDLVNKGCIAPEEPICDDLDPCTTDSYDAGTMMCRHVRISCDDANALTTDTCNSGTGVCMHASCDSGYADCDGSSANGCEASTNTDTANCGSCGNACPAVPNGVPSCSAGTCAIGSCNTDYGDCDSQYGNGCEIDLRITTDACGSCGNTCPAVANGVPSCSAGTCGIGSCDSWFEDCDNDVSTGCETDIGTDTGNCGSCGNTCTESDDHGSPSCTEGMCGITCDSEWTLCDGAGSLPGEFGLITPIGVCVDLDTDALNCGTCGYVCDLPNTDYHACDAGQCVVDSCDEGWEDCDGTNGNGCETDIYNDEYYCGDCYTQCDEFKECDKGYCDWIS